MQRHSPLFPLGQFVATPAALAACPFGRMLECLSQHHSGDWGIASDEDKEANLSALANQLRIISIYPIDPMQSTDKGRNTLWIITEGTRNATTALLPEDYFDVKPSRVPTAAEGIPDVRPVC